MIKRLKNRKKTKKPKQYTLFQRFGLFFYDRTKLVAFLAIGLVGFGLLSYTVLMRKQGFPDVAVPISTVSVNYFVNDKNKVDTDVAVPLAESIGKVEHVKSVDTIVGDNFATAVIKYDEGTDAVAGSAAVQSAVEAKGDIPKDAKLEFKALNAGKYNGEYDMLVAVYADPNTSLVDLQAQAEKLSGELAKADHVKTVKVLPALEASTDAATGKSTQVQHTFDRIGIRENGQNNFYNAVNVGVVFTDNADLLKASASVNDQLDKIAQIPEFAAIKTHVAADFAPSISDQTASLQKNLLEGLAVVILISLLLISLRAGIATALAMTSTLLISLGVLFVMGITINTISLFALILCLGLIVDDITIVVEAIDALKDSYKDNREVVAQALKRVARASTAGTLVTILAFAPMLFISGILGEFIHILPITIIVSLIVSLLVSLTLIPFFAKFLILPKKHETHKPNKSPIAWFERRSSEGLANIIRIGNRSRAKLTIIGVSAIVFSFVLIFVGGVYFSKLRFDIFPAQKDGDEIGLSLKFPATSTIDSAQSKTDEVNAAVGVVLGENFKQLSYDSSGNALNATGLILLKPFHSRNVTSQALTDQLNARLSQIPDVTVKAAASGVGPPSDDLPFATQIYSEDPAKALVLAQDISNDLRSMELTLPNGNVVKVNKVEIAPPVLTTRKDGKLFTEVRAGFDSADTSSVVIKARDKIQADFPDSKLSEKYGMSAGSLKFDFGDESDNQESFGSMLVAFPILLLIMYVLLAIQFRSFLQPLVIFLAIPFSFLGVGMGLHYTNNALSFFVMLGFFALIGIAVNNTILLTDYANQAHREGQGRIDSIASALQARFRPLITTSLTSIVALIPLALSDPFWQSLSVTLIFGLISSTLIVLIAFPYYLLAAEVVRAGGRGLWHRISPRQIYRRTKAKPA